MPTQQPFLVRPLFMQVRDEIALKIATGFWKAGSLLPNEVQIAKDFNVSTGTARKALDVLEAEKIVVRQQGRGTLVVDHDTEEMAVRFSSILNSDGQRIAGHVASAEVVTELPTQEECQKLRIQPTEKVIRMTRIKHYHDHAFAVELISLVARTFADVSMSKLKSSRLTSLAQSVGLSLSHGVEEVTPIMCPEDKLEIFGLSQPEPILLLRRTVFDLKGVPVEFKKSWVRLTEKQYVSVTR